MTPGWLPGSDASPEGWPLPPHRLSHRGVTVDAVERRAEKNSTTTGDDHDTADAGKIQTQAGKVDRLQEPSVTAWPLAAVFALAPAAIRLRGAQAIIFVAIVLLALVAIVFAVRRRRRRGRSRDTAQEWPDERRDPTRGGDGPRWP
jgi:Flp pilus assembly protein TadB